MVIRLFGIKNHSFVDGEGVRLVVFTQGCPHNCEGCHNPDSHSFYGGTLADTSEIIETMRCDRVLDGLTLSGGEPFWQSEACLELAKEAHRFGLNVWCYTGYTWEHLLKVDEWVQLLKELDILVDGKFEQDKRTDGLYYRGSSNQRVIDVQSSLRERKVIIYHE